MVDADSQAVAKERKYADTEDPHVEAVAKGHCDGPFNFMFISFGLGLRYGRQKDDRQGVGDGRRKEDKGQRHTGQDAVCTQGLGIGKAEFQQLIWHKDGLQALQAVKNQPVAHQRQGHGHQGSCQGDKAVGRPGRISILFIFRCKGVNEETENSGCRLPDQHTPDSQGHGDFLAVCSRHTGNQENSANADKLFQKL